MWKEKERQILEAVRTLMQEGRDLSAVKTDEIAQTAGIGKGTLYLYFPAKEELLRQGVLYAARRQAEEIAGAARKDSFAEGFAAVLRCTRRFFEKEAPALRMMFHSIKDPLCGGEPLLSCAILGKEGCEKIQQTVELLYQMSLDEGLFPPCPHPYLLQMAFVGALAGFCTAASLPDLDAAEAENAAIQLFTRSMQR